MTTNSPTQQTEAKHTPGPWAFNAESGNYSPGMSVVSNSQAVSPAPLLVAKLPSWDDRYSKEAAANGRVLAAAPDLLESLQDLIYCATCDTRHMQRFEALFAKAQRALAKALNA